MNALKECRWNPKPVRNQMKQYVTAHQHKIRVQFTPICRRLDTTKSNESSIVLLTHQFLTRQHVESMQSASSFVRNGPCGWDGRHGEGFYYSQAQYQQQQPEFVGDSSMAARTVFLIRYRSKTTWCCCLSHDLNNCCYYYFSCRVQYYIVAMVLRINLPNIHGLR